MPTNTMRRRGALWVLVASALITVAGAACEPAPLPPATPPTSGTTTPAAPAVAQAACPAGGSITVSTTIVANVRNLLAAAKAAKVNLCGSGYRDQQRQVELRKQNCGPTYYDIWQKPSSQCSPPTAVPGTSMHEKGLAIDFSSCSTASTPCFTWLSAHASEFGLRNLPSEPWHWSTNGRSRHAEAPDV